MDQLFHTIASLAFRLCRFSLVRILDSQYIGSWRGLAWDLGKESKFSLQEGVSTVDRFIEVGWNECVVDVLGGLVC